jgi:hypothetical protein
MLSGPKYRYFTSDQHKPIDAVKVVISQKENIILADVEWPSNTKTDAGDYLYPTNVPLALERAVDVWENYGFAEIVVIIDDVELWGSSWGILEKQAAEGK